MIVATNRSTAILVGILVVQLVLAAVLFMPRGEETDPLVTYEIELADRILISSMDEDPIELRLEDGQWFLQGGLVADTSRLETLLEALGSDRWSWPVASTSEAARRFEVTEDAFQRQVELFAEEEELATLYLGTSPSFRLIHAREADSDSIYAIELASYDLPMRQDDWLDKSLLRTAGAVDSMERVGEWKAELDGEGNWRFVEPSLAANSAELSGMATRFETLRVMGVSDEVPDRAPDLEFEVVAAGETIRYGFYRPPKDEEESEDGAEEGEGEAEEEPRFDTSTRDTLVKSSLRDEYFRVSSFTVDQLEKSIEELVGVRATHASPEVDEPDVAPDAQSDT